jgi:hypothetical protein
MNTSPEHRPAFQRQQLAFTAHIRDPSKHPLPAGIPDTRMAVYTELFFNGIEDQLSTCFPVLRKITDDNHWLALVRDFFARHRCRTPLFTEIGQEFIDYLEAEHEPSPGDWPFMLELAHYEYAELAVSISDANATPGEYDPNGDLLQGCPLVSPTAWVLSYQYPVHRIGPGFLPKTPGPQPTHLVVYRDRKDAVHFLEINPVTHRLLGLLKETPRRSGLQLLEQIAEELRHPEPDKVIHSGSALLNDLHQRNVILGTHRN